MKNKYDRIMLRERSEVEIIKPYCDMVVESDGVGGVRVFDKLNTYWECKPGINTASFYLQSNPKLNFHLGINRLCLMPMDLEDVESSVFMLPASKLKGMFKKQELVVKEFNKSGEYVVINPAKADVELIKDEIRDKMSKQTLYVKEVPRIPIEYQELIRDSFDWKDLLNDYFLNEGWHVDPVIINIMKSNLIRFDRFTVPVNKIMKYNPHGFVITNSKTAKTTLADKIGTKIDDASGSGLLGFSTANESHRGTLHGTSGLIALDEKGTWDAGVYSYLFGSLENGIARIDKGKNRIENHTMATILSLLNPPERDYAEGDQYVENQDPQTKLIDNRSRTEAAHSFERVIGKETTNPEALGSRMGILLFNIGLSTSHKLCDITQENLEKNEAIIQHVLDQTQEKVTQLFFAEPIQQWLNRPIKKYANSIRKSISKIGVSTIIKRVWKGQMNAFRHNRGYGLKMSLLDNLWSIWQEDSVLNNEELIGKIILDAQEWTKYLCELNLESLNNFVEADKAMGDLMQEMYATLRKKYLLPILYGYAFMCTADEDKKFLSVPIRTLQSTHELVALDESLSSVYGSYTNWREVKRRLDSSKSLSRFNKEISIIYGIEFVNNEEDYIQVSDPQKFAAFKKSLNLYPSALGALEYTIKKESNKDE